MWQNVPPPPFNCKMCGPPTFYRAYDELRQHLRFAHGLKKISQAELRLFETYPDSRRHAPKTLRQTGQQSTIRSRVGSRPESRVNSRNASPRRVDAQLPDTVSQTNAQSEGSGSQTVGHASQQIAGDSQHAVLSQQNVGNSVKVNPFRSKPAKTDDVGNVAISLSPDGKRSVRNVTNQIKVPETSGQGQNNAQTVETSSNTDVGQTNGVDLSKIEVTINNLIEARIEAAVKERLPMLSMEITTKVGQALKDKLPSEVGKAVYKIASSYLDSDVASNASYMEFSRDRDRSADYISPRQRLMRYASINQIEIQCARNAKKGLETSHKRIPSLISDGTRIYLDESQIIHHSASTGSNDSNLLFNTAEKRIEQFMREMDEENGFDSNSTPKDPLIETDESIERHMVGLDDKVIYDLKRKAQLLAGEPIVPDVEEDEIAVEQIQCALDKEFGHGPIPYEDFSARMAGIADSSLESSGRSIPIEAYTEVVDLTETPENQPDC